MPDDLASLDAMHQGVHAIADRLVAMRAALTTQGFSEYAAEAVCVQYSSVIMNDLRELLEAQREAARAAGEAQQVVG